MTSTRHRTRRLWAATTLAVVATVGAAGGAAADDVYSDLDATVDATAELMPLNAGGPDGTTTLYIQPAGGDGKSGCNLTGGTTLRVRASSSDTAVATVSLDDDTFTSCGDSKLLTVHPVGAGAATVTLSQVSNTSAGSFDFAPATFTVDVSAPAPANTAPRVGVHGVTPGAAYEKGSVPTPSCEVVDAEDADESAAPVITGTLDDDGLGSQTATCSYTDAGGLEAVDAVTYSIVDGSAPAIAYSLDPATADGDDGWYRGDVTLTWHVSEPDSPSSLRTAGCEDQTITADQLATAYTCSASSSGGTAGPVTASVKRDGNGPHVEFSGVSGTAGDDGWYTSAVTARFAASDEFSGVAGDATGTTTSTTDGTAVVLDSPAFSDNAGNTTAAGAAQSPALKIDTVAPAVGDAVLSGDQGDNGWYTSAVTASFTGTDHTSGVAGDNPKIVSTGSSQGEVTLLSPEFRDVAGNTTAAGANRATVEVDSVDPSVGLVGGPAAGASYYFGSVPGAPTCDASDETSGLAGDCTVSGHGTGVGPHTVTASATDRAGNTATVSRTYTVLAWTAKGFYAPVDMGGVHNTVKGGSTVPLKFELFAGPTELTDVASVRSFTTQRITCSGDVLEDGIEMLATGGTSLRYNATGGQFIQNWKTPTGAGTCYRATMTAQDGSAVSALFKIK